MPSQPKAGAAAKKTAASKKAASKKATSKKTSSKKAASKKATSKKASSKTAAKKQAGSAKKRAKHSCYWRWFKISCYLLLLAAAIFIVAAIYLNQRISAKFAQDRWSLPARVYARPLLIYQGQNIYRQNLVYELQAANYQRLATAASVAKQQGSYHLGAGVLTLKTRDFDYWDGHSNSELYQINLSADSVRTIKVLKPQGAKQLTLMRVDPAPIGYINPQHNADRDLINIHSVPESLLTALLLVEDRSFYQHHGLRPSAILRALLVNLRAGRTVQGGSTLTQQLVKNYFLNAERSWSRKAAEAVMTLLLEARYSKAKILEAYVNEIFLGQDGSRAIHGMALASRFYFDKQLRATNLAEQALLVALIKAPSYYNPRRHSERALARRNLVLKLLHEFDYIDAAQYQHYKNMPLGVVNSGKLRAPKYAHFMELLRQQLAQDYATADLQTAGLKIFTSLAPSVQQQLQQAATAQLDKLRRRYHLDLQVGAVFADSNSGEVLALIGGYDPNKVGFNRALNIRRQIGSLVKPAVFLSAFDAGYNVSSLLSDTPFTWQEAGKTWRPQNFAKQTHGMVPAYMALLHSYNLASARLGLDIGVDKVASNLRRMGYAEPINLYPSLLLGALESSPYEVANMYQTLAGGGFHTKLRAVRAVIGNDGRRLARYGVAPQQSLRATSTYITTAIMQQINLIGTAKAVGAALPQLHSAGKTGTSNDGRDAWYAGFSGSMLGVVWVGSDANKASKLTGASAALPVWLQVFSKVYSAPLLLQPQQNIKWQWIDAAGNNFSSQCANTIALPFVRGSEPPLQDCAGAKPAKSWWQRLFD